MTQTATLDRLRQTQPAEAAMPVVTMGFDSLQSFELMQRAARLLSSSTLVPPQYRAVTVKTDWNGVETSRIENPNALANAVVALNMATRMKADPLMVMQNLYIIEGRPSWSSQWIIAAINGCGRFSPLRFEIKTEGKKTVEYTTTTWVDRQRQTNIHKVEIDNKVCIAWAIEKETGARIESPPVSIEMAVKEGWYGKTGSKWQTMDEVMLRYRTAAFFGKLYAPELLMGLQTAEEVQDIIEARPDGSGAYTTDLDSLREQARPVEPEPVVEPVAVVEEPAAEPAPPPKATPAKSAAPQSSPPPTLAEVLALVEKGDFLFARDLARGLGDTARADVEKAIADAMAKRSTKPRQPDLADQ